MKRIAVVLVALLGSTSAGAVTFTTLANFSDSLGRNPFGTLVADPSGRLFGVTESGGSDNLGTVFQLDPGGGLTRLASFTNLYGHGQPTGGLVYSEKNLGVYGVTRGDASISTNRGSIFGVNTHAPDLLFPLHIFNKYSLLDTLPTYPIGRLLTDADDNLFGTTLTGGASNSGTIFRRGFDGSFAVLHEFSGVSGSVLAGGLVADIKGNIFGVTELGGANNRGSIFSIGKDGKNFTTLYSFSATDNVYYPNPDLLIGPDGNLFGTTNGTGAYLNGSIFRLDSGGGLTTLHSFSGTDGRGPYYGLVADANGNLYGTTGHGGANDAGTIFRIKADGSGFTTLHSFAGADGRTPLGGLLIDAEGNLFGTTYYGGSNDAGTIFRLSDLADPPPPPGGLPKPPPPTSAPKPTFLDINDNYPQSFVPSTTTIVITHGWQPIAPGEGPDQPAWMRAMRQDIEALVGGYQHVNLILVYWEDALTSGPATPDALAEALRTATAKVAFQGALLAEGLKQLDGSFEGGIQFIGHGLGALVNAYAANYLTSAGIKVDQFTILDRPFGRGIPTDDIGGPVGSDADQRIFRTLLPQGDVRFVDNYWGDITLYLPPIYTSPATGASLSPFADVFDVRYAGIDHEDVVQLYRASIGSSQCVQQPNGGGFGCSLVGGGFGVVAAAFPWDPKAASLDQPSEPVMLDPIAWLTFNCELNGTASATCQESSPAYLWTSAFSFDTSAEFLSFEFAWHEPGDGDWLTLHFDDILLYSGTGLHFTPDVFYSSGFLPVADLRGRTGQLLFSLNSVGQADASFSIRNITIYNMATPPVSGPIPEPGIWAMLIAGFGLVGGGLRVRRRRREMALDDRAANTI